MDTAIAIAYFVISVVNDDLNVQWHKARENNQPIKAGNISFLMGLIAWLPYVLFVTTQNWQIIIADLIGNWIGSYIGVKRHKFPKINS